MAFYRDIKYRASDTADIQTLDNITFDGSSSYSLTRDSAAFTPSGASNILLSIDGVVQSGNFTITGSTIDFGVNVPATSECDFILHLGVGVINTPADGSVTEPKIANGAVSLNKLSATGTKDSTTFLRGDNTFATVSPSMYPAFEAKLSSAQSISDDTFVKVQFDSEVYDTNNAYDNTTNYRFTVPTGFAGKYLVYCTLQLAGDGGTLDILDTGLRIYKNGSSVLWNSFAADDTSTADRNVNIAISTVLDLSESDYLEIYGLVNSVSGTQSITGDSDSQKRSYFGAYRIGD